MADNDYFLKEVCGELAEIALAARYGVSQDELFDKNGCFYEQYQDVFNTLYDYAEEKMTYHFNIEINSLVKTSNIYTTGAFLAPVKVIDNSGAAIWVWAVSQFEDDSYLDGEICDPVERAESAEKLLIIDNENNDE